MGSFSLKKKEKKKKARLLNIPRMNPDDPFTDIRKLSNEFKLSIYSGDELLTDHHASGGDIPLVSEGKRIGVMRGPPPPAHVTAMATILVREIQTLRRYQAMCEDTNFFSRDLFLANISHEIRTPLNGVIGYGQLLGKTTLNPTQRKYVERMNACSVHLMKIINDIIDFSKLSSGQMSVSRDCFSLDEVIAQIKSAVHLQYIEKKQKATFHHTVKEKIVTDKHKLVQIAVNLLSNAVTYTPIGGTIKLLFRQEAENLVMEVEDNGIGISTEDQCRIFNIFVQVNNSTVKLGSGLGLAIVRRLLDLMGGKIDVKSRLGEGSIFTVRIPITLSTTVEAEVVSVRKLGGTVLVVDDNLDNRIILEDTLWDWNLESTVCSTATEALRALKRKEYDVCLVDICMPEMSGIELGNQIREFLPAQPLIALSSLVEPVGPRDCECFDYFLSKPVDNNQLLLALLKILRQREPREAPGPPEAKSFLIAEDYDDNKTVLKAFLVELGYTDIAEAQNGEEAVALLQQRSFDFLLLDLRMPKMDGFGVLEFLNRQRHRPVVIAVTACSLDFEMEKCRRLGVQLFVKKPVQLNKLHSAIIKGKSG